MVRVYTCHPAVRYWLTSDRNHMAENAASQEPGSLLQVGDLTIDRAGARVWRRGVELALPKLSYDLLLALVDIAPAIATTDALLERVWPGLVVNPETVSQRIKLLRTALGDDPRQPRYLAVVRGRGYRLVADVVPLPPAPAARAAPVPADSGPADVTTLSYRNWRVALVAALVVVALAAAFWWPTPDSTLPPTELRAMQQKGTDRSIAVLPFENLGAAQDDAALALGIADTILHQLGNLPNLEVIARTSSFAVNQTQADARQIGERLGAAFLLEGSVQRIDAALRVTAQLIDTTTGAHVWSLQFDRSTRDVFAVQDEIALKVARALELSLDTSSSERLAGRGTTDFDAYFEFVQARSLLGGGRIADLPIAIQHLNRAIRLDANFARAYAELAGAEMRLAEYEPGGNRNDRFNQAAASATNLLAQAIALDPDDGRAYIQRAYLHTFSDLAAAEQDYRKGLALAPSDASGYEGLASLLYQDPLRHDEALTALDRARRLDPLEPRYDVTKAGLLFHRRGDATSALAILQRTVEQFPQYAPALTRYAEIQVWIGHVAQGIRYHELALQLDPSAEWNRRGLLTAYIDLGDLAAAESVRAKAPEDVPLRALLLQIYRQQWRQAGETTYQALQSGTVLSVDEYNIAVALRRDARVTGEVAAARAALEQMADLHWNSDGEPVFPELFDLRAAPIGVADMLFLEHKEEQAKLLLRKLLIQDDRAVRDYQRGANWTRLARAQALAMLGDSAGAIAALQALRTDNALLEKYWMHLTLDPSFDSIRELPEYRRILAEMEQHAKAERQLLDKLRAEGLVPKRS
jgi:TolB-like protein/DNA-binding winged helix-turn-helix (wHTH) protein